MAREEYLKEKQRIEKEIQMVDRILGLNKIMVAQGWSVLHPYQQMIFIEQLEKLAQSQSLDSNTIFQYFAREFHDLRFTATCLKGYYKKRKHLRPFCLIIDQSVVMALEHNYAGAINVLIPAIEGAIRSYLVSVKGKVNEKIMKSEHLFQAFNYMHEDVVKVQEDALKIKQFEKGQVRNLMRLYRDYYGKWFSIIVEYLKNGLFFPTRKGTINDPLNRHVILHGFSANWYFTFPNFLKLFHVLHFLSWVFGLVTQGESILAELSNLDHLNKWIALEKIRLVAELSMQEKLAVLKAYPEFQEGLQFFPVLVDNFAKEINQNPKLSIEAKLLAWDNVYEMLQKK